MTYISQCNCGTRFESDTPITMTWEVDIKAENERLQQHVHDLQSGMYINCVYCGHRYGPQDEVPATMADALKEHIEQCEKHPMSALKGQVKTIQKKCADIAYEYAVGCRDSAEEIAAQRIGDLITKMQHGVG